MAKLEKLLQKIRNGPNNVTPNKLNTLLLGYGFKYREGSKHWRVYWHESLGSTGRITVPFQRPLKAYIVKQALKLIDRLENEEG
jgi:hypothetical protein